MKTDEIKGVLREYKKTNELWMNPNDIVDCLNDLLASRKALEEIRDISRGDMQLIAEEALKEEK
jgi:hypothetical protein